LDNATLYVVATPIGNLEDLSPRARQILGRVDLIAAEDTRHTGRLLSHFGINTRQIALHDHNEEVAVSRVLSALADGQSVALVSDAGTPLISDPGYRLVCAAHDASIKVSPVPGPSALTAALSVAGLPTDRFCFEGFLPSRKSGRIKKIRALSAETRTIVLFESVHRIEATINDLNDELGSEKRAFIGRELSKMHEQCESATLGDLKTMIEDGQLPAKGEIVLILEGSQQADADTVSIRIDQLIEEISAVLSTNQAADLVSTLSGRRRNEIYKMLLARRKD
jgi:16S rRNA (cytidine1402-2'-O)-methyltransferase